MECRGERVGFFINGLINNTNDAASYLTNRLFLFFCFFDNLCLSCVLLEVAVIIHARIKELHSVVYRSGHESCKVVFHRIVKKKTTRGDRRILCWFIPSIYSVPVPRGIVYKQTHQE